MLITARRIVKANHASTAFSGEGAAKFGGRWNSRGTAVVYTSGSKALAALELLVHLVPPVQIKFVAISVQFDSGLVRKLSGNELPADWKEQPPGSASKLVGDKWVKSAESAVLEVPSALISGEVNYLINPAHAKFGRVAIGSAEGFTFDPRLLSIS